MSQATVKLMLPNSVATKNELARLVQELERIDAALIEVTARKRVGAAVGEGPRYSDQMIDFLNVNNITLDDSRVRSGLLVWLRKLKNTAPIVHLTFASQADTESLQHLVDWVRQSIHVQAVLTVGLQPDLIGGVYVRTKNRVHDFSMRARLQNARHLITEELEAINAGR